MNSAQRVPVAASPVITGMAGIAAGLVGTRIFVFNGISVAGIVAIVLLPVWITALPRYRGAITVAVIGLVAIVGGLWLSEVASPDHARSASGEISDVFLIVSMIGGLGVLLWARTLLPDWVVGTMFGIGMTVSSVLTDGFTSANPWKFGLGFPIMVVILAFVARPGWRWAETAALLALAASAILTDSRYRFGALMISALFVAWQMLPRTSHRRASAVGTVIIVAATAFVMYNVLSTLLIGGYLGEDAQSRSVDQLDRTGSLLLGGRPELGATLALMQHRPLGFGVGVDANLTDILVAKTGMAGLNYQPNNGYVDDYLFGNGIELHSVAGDLWASFGIPGLLLAAAVFVIILVKLGTSLSERTATGLVLFLSMSTLWNLLFSPIYGSFQALVLTVALCALPRKRLERPPTGIILASTRRPASDGVSRTSAPTA